jgi:hypothetical protein
MCKYATIHLRSADCELLRIGQEAHQYPKHTYWLCKRSRNNQPCDKQIPKENTVGTDIGSRQGPCPVCSGTKSANDEYERAIQRATEQYNQQTQEAYDTQQAELERAQYVVETHRYHSN